MSKRYSIVGTAFTGTPESFIAGLPSGHDVVLIREPNNQFDPLAVAVWASGQKIGYVPKKQNEPLAAMIDASGTDVGAMAMDGNPTGSKYVTAKFVRSPTSGFPMVEV